MVTYKIDPSFSIPVIDVPATSKRLKELRESLNITVAQIQKLLGMENPQSIYTWENANEKYLPRLDNLVTLAKLYKVSLDELIVIKTENTEVLPIKRPTPPYAIAQETLDFINNNTNNETKLALEKYYGFSWIASLRSQ